MAKWQKLENDPKALPTSHLFHATIFDHLPPARVTVETETQHTLAWDVDAIFTSESKPMPAGSLNLYRWPGGYEGAELAGLENLLLAFASSSMMLLNDSVGAHPIHALLVANNQQALSLAFRMFEARPRLMTQPHGQGPFLGEVALHVLCANRQEQHACRLVRLMKTRLEKNEFEHALRTQTAGQFFEGPPMVLYGDSPLSYACIFGLKELVQQLLATGVVNLNEGHSKISGLLPLHAVAANGLCEMYTFMRGLGAELRASRNELTLEGRLTALPMGKIFELDACTPLQVAWVIGQKTMVQHIMQEQTAVLWKWGAVTAFQLDLNGIDSAGDGAHDCMELVGHPNASRATQEFILDSFMQGLVYKLFREKWNKYGYRIQYAWRTLDVVLTIAICALAFRLKWYTDYDVEATQTLAAATILLIAISAACEAWTTRLYWHNQVEKATHNDGNSLKTTTIMGRAFQWMNEFDLHLKAASYLFTLVAIVLYYFVISHNVEHKFPEEFIDADLESTLRRGLKGAGGADSNIEEEHILHTARLSAFVGYEPLVYLLLALASALKFFVTFQQIVMPFERVNVFILEIKAVLTGDLLVFMFIFGVAMGASFLMLLLMFPHHPQIDAPPQVPAFSNGWDSAMAIFNAGVVGAALEIKLDPAAFQALGIGQKANLVVFYACYFLYLIFALVLLLNLLIALLSDSFANIQIETILQTRLAFAKCLLRLELIAEAVGMETSGGTRTPSGTNVYEFRVVDKNAENGDYPFCPSEDMFREFETVEPEWATSFKQSIARQLETLTAQVEGNRAENVVPGDDVVTGAKLEPVTRARAQAAVELATERRDAGKATSAVESVGEDAQRNGGDIIPDLSFAANVVVLVECRLPERPPAPSERSDPFADAVESLLEALDEGLATLQGGSSDASARRTLLTQTEMLQALSSPGLAQLWACTLAAMDRTADQPFMKKLSVAVPQFHLPNEPIPVEFEGQTYEVQVPRGVRPGQKFEVELTSVQAFATAVTDAVSENVSRLAPKGQGRSLAL